ncbi:MAG TPA: hypothetical protein PK239_07260 [Chitinophagales bacterium]|nr:hypothetical protein [Chitinophagales bacterium]
MAKFTYYIFLLFLFFTQYLFIRDAYIDIVVYKKGKIVNAEIKQVNCSRKRSNLYLIYANSNHSIFVSSNKCLDGMYQVGDFITVRVLPEYRRAQFPDAYAYGGVFGVIFFFILLIFWILLRREIIMHFAGKVNPKGG